MLLQAACAYAVTLKDIPEIEYGSGERIQQDFSDKSFIHYETPFYGVYDIKADGDYIWIALYSGGVMRYDTKSDTWRIFTKSDGLNYFQIHKIGITPEYVYAIGENNGRYANRFNRVTQKWENIPYNDLPALKWNYSDDPANPEIKRKGNELVHGGNGQGRVLETESDIWVGFDGICRFNKAHKTWTCWSQYGTFNRDITSIQKVNDKTIWFGSRNGIIELNKENGVWRRLSTVDGLFDNAVISMAEENGTIVVIHPNGLSKFQIKTQKWSSEPDIQGANHLLLQDGVLWLGDSKGVRLKNLSGRTQLVLPPNFEGHAVSGIVAQAGSIWLGTDNGLYSYKLSSGEWSAWTYQNGTFSQGAIPEIKMRSGEPEDYFGEDEYCEPGTTILGLGVRKNNLIIVMRMNCITEDAPLAEYLIEWNPLNGNISASLSGKNVAWERIGAIVEDGEDLWLTDSTDLYQVQYSSREFIKYERVPAITENAFLPLGKGLTKGAIVALKKDGGILWVGMDKGIGAYEPKSGWRTFTQPGPSHSYALDILNWKGTAWAQPGYVHNFIAAPWARYDISTNKWRSYSFENGWHPFAGTMQITGDMLWYADSNGVKTLDLNSGATKEYPNPSKSKVNGILVDKDIWAITANELSVWSEDTKSWRVFGFDEAEINRHTDSTNKLGLSLAKQGDKIWIGHNTGVARFDLYTKSFEYLNETVDNSPINGIVIVNHNVWLIGDKVFLFEGGDPQNQKFLQVPSAKHVIDIGEYIACATNEKELVYLLNKNQKTILHLDVSGLGIRRYRGAGALAIDGKNLWVGGYELSRIPYKRLEDLFQREDMLWQERGSQIHSKKPE